MGGKKDQVGPLGHRAVIRCERAVAELRAGRPIVIRSGSRSIAALALDAATPGIYDAFAVAAAHEHQLFLTRHRASALGLEAESGCVVPLKHASHEQACRLAYSPRHQPPAVWTHASAPAGVAARLARLALLLPAMVLADQPANPTFLAECLEVGEEDIAQAFAAAARSFEIVARSHVPLQDIGRAEFVVFRGGLAQRDQLAILLGSVQPNEAVAVRIHSACITGDLFGSLKCDCGEQLKQGLRLLNDAGGGVLLYLDQEGRGTGIASKMRAYGYQEAGLDTFDADAELGFGPDEREYDTAVAMLGELGLGRVKLLTNNPDKVESLRAAGIDVVGRIPVIGGMTAENHWYLHAKKVRGGHLLPLAEA